MTGINFDALPGFELPEEQTQTPFTPKHWDMSLQPKFEKQCVKLTRVGKNQNRILIPKLLVDAYNITNEFNAYFIPYYALGKITMIISKDNVEDATYTRKITPIGVGLYYTMMPPQIQKHMDFAKWPDFIWLVNTPKSTKEDIILEVWPA